MSKYKLKEGFSWATFEAIENELSNIIRYLPLETQQYNVFSFQLGDVIKNSCSQIDSIFKEIARQCNLSDHPDQTNLKKYIIRIKKNDRKISILDHADIFSNYLNLPNMEITIRRNFHMLEPFKTFTKTTSPKWWQEYNKLKHDYYNNIHLSTLENALDSLSALFCLQCKIRELYTYLVYNQIFISPNLDYTDMMIYVDKEPSLEKFSVMARSKIFECWVSHNPDTIGIKTSFKSGGLEGDMEDLDKFTKKYGNKWYEQFTVK